MVDKEKKLRKVSISSDSVRAYGLKNLTFPKRPIFQQLLAMHALYLSTFERIIPTMQDFIEGLDFSRSPIFKMWRDANPALKSVDGVSYKLAVSMCYFLFKGFDEQNRLNFEIDLINNLSKFEFYHFHKDNVGLLLFLADVFKAIDYEFHFGDVISTAPSKKKKDVDHELFRNGLVEHFGSNEETYRQEYNKVLDGHPSAKMMMLASDRSYSSMLPNRKHNYHVHSGNVEHFNCQIKSANLDPNKIKFNEQLFVNYANHWHDGNMDKAKETLNVVLKGDGDEEQVASFKGYLPLHTPEKLMKEAENGFERYVRVMNQIGRGTPTDIYDLHNIYHAYNKEDGIDDVEEEEDIEEDHDEGEIVRTTFDSVATPLNPAFVFRKAKGDDVKLMKKQLDQMYNALVQCNKDRKEALKRKGELLDTTGFEDSVDEAPQEDVISPESMAGIKETVDPRHFYRTLMGKDKEVNVQQLNELAEELEKCNRVRRSLIAKLGKEDAQTLKFNSMLDLLDFRNPYRQLIKGDKERLTKKQHVDDLLSESRGQSTSVYAGDESQDPDAASFDSPLDTLKPFNLYNTLRHGDELENLKKSKYAKLLEDRKKNPSSFADLAVDDHDEPSATSFESPFELLDPMTGYRAIIHGDTTKNSENNKYAALIRESNQNAEEFEKRDMFGAPNPFKSVWRTATASDKKEMDQQKEELYNALIQCDEDIKMLRKKIKEKEAKVEEQATMDGRQSSRKHDRSDHRALKRSEGVSTFDHHIADHITLSPMLFEASNIVLRDMSPHSKEMVESFKSSLLELYEKENFTAVEMEDMKNDVNVLLAVIKDGGDKIIEGFVTLVLIAMYNTKLTMLNVKGIQEAKLNEEKQLEPLPYHDQLHKRKSFLKDRKEERIAARLMEDDHVVEPEEEEEEHEERRQEREMERKIQEEEHQQFLEVKRHPIIETPEDEEKMKAFTKEVSIAGVLEPMKKSQVGKQLLLNNDGTVKIRSKFDPSEYVGWLVNLFKGDGNKLVEFTKKLYLTMRQTVGKMMTFADQHGLNKTKLIGQIKSVLGQLDYIKKPVKDYALKAVHFIPQLIKESNLDKNLMGVFKFLVGVVGQLMQYSTKVFVWVIENKAIFNNALSWVVKGGKYIGSNASSLTSGGTKLLSNVTPYAMKGIGTVTKSVGGGSKLLTASAGSLISTGTSLIKV